MPGALERLRERVRYSNSYTRLPDLIEAWKHLALDCEPHEWLTVLGEEWSGCDNIAQFVDQLFDETPFGEALDYPGAMMTPDEQTALRDLPDEVEVYRGCYLDNKWGLSWSLDRAVAAKFPGLHRYCRPSEPPLLVRAKIAKAKVIALKLDREEAEIICWRPRHVSTSKLRWAS